MDRAGVDLSCLNSIYHPEGTTANDLTQKLVAAHPDRFVGFAYVSPVMPERVVPELTRAIGDLGFVGIKLYPFSTPWALNRPEWDPIYAFADEHRLPILIHTEEEDRCYPRYIQEVAPRYPNATFVAGHSGNTPGGRAQAIKAAVSCENVYCETCSTFRSPGAIEELVDGAGAHKVLFGSDMPLMDPRAQLGKVITARISRDAKRLITGVNAARILGMQV